MAAVVKLQLFCVVTLSSSTLLSAFGNEWIAFDEDDVIVLVVIVGKVDDAMVDEANELLSLVDVVTLDTVDSLLSLLFMLRSRHSNVSTASFSFSLSDMDGSRCGFNPNTFNRLADRPSKLLSVSKKIK